MQQAKVLKQLQSGEKIDFASLMASMNSMNIPKGQLAMVESMTKMLPKELQNIDISPILSSTMKHLEGKKIEDTGPALASLAPIMQKSLEKMGQNNDVSFESVMKSFADEVVEESKKDDLKPIGPKVELKVGPKVELKGEIKDDIEDENNDEIKSEVTVEQAKKEYEIFQDEIQEEPTSMCNELVTKWKMHIIFVSGVVLGIASQFIV